MSDFGKVLILLCVFSIGFIIPIVHIENTGYYSRTTLVAKNCGTFVDDKINETKFMFFKDMSPSTISQMYSKTELKNFNEFIEKARKEYERNVK